MSEPPKQPPGWDYEKWTHGLRRDDAQRAHDRVDSFAESTHRAAVEGGNIALRTLVVVNGAAAVSVLAFIGSLIGQGELSVEAGRDLANILTWFAIGVAAATVAMGLGYLTNYCRASSANSRLRIWEHPYLQARCSTRAWSGFAIIFQLVSIGLAGASITLFLFGMLDLGDAIGRLK